jgi:peptide/nickel transport system permease protein
VVKLLKEQNYRSALRQGGARLGANLLTLVVLSMIIFALMNFKSSEDIARSVLGREVNVEQITAFVIEHRLDKPLLPRFIDWVSRAVEGDLGRSVVTGREVAGDVMPRFARSLILAALGGFAGIAVGVLTGVAPSQTPSWRPFDRAE